MKLSWSPSAQRDLEQLHEHIAKNSPFYARQFIERIFISVDRLQQSPKSGRVVPEAGFQEHIREIIFQGYRIIYLLENGQHVQVVAVLHGSRELLGILPPWKA